MYILNAMFNGLYYKKNTKLQNVTLNANLTPLYVALQGRFQPSVLHCPACRFTRQSRRNYKNNKLTETNL